MLETQPETSNLALVSFFGDPVLFKEVVKSEEWKTTMQKEIDSIQKIKNGLSTTYLGR